MINLLPYDKKEILKKNYKKRLSVMLLGVVSFLFIMFALFIGVLLYVHMIEVKTLTNQKERLTEIKNSQGFNSLSTYVSSLNKSIIIFDTLIKGEKNLHPRIENILAAKVSGVEILGYEYNLDIDKKSGFVAISGTANNRDRVLAFANSLNTGEKPACDSVSIPIMTYTNRENLPFVVTCKIIYEK